MALPTVLTTGDHVVLEVPGPSVLNFGCFLRFPDRRRVQLWFEEDRSYFELLTNVTEEPLMQPQRHPPPNTAASSRPAVQSALRVLLKNKARQPAAQVELRAPKRTTAASPVNVASILCSPCSTLCPTAVSISNDPRCSSQQDLLHPATQSQNDRHGGTCQRIPTTPDGTASRLLRPRHSAWQHPGRG